MGKNRIFFPLFLFRSLFILIFCFIFFLERKRKKFVESSYSRRNRRRKDLVYEKKKVNKHMRGEKKTTIAKKRMNILDTLTAPLFYVFFPSLFLYAEFYAFILIHFFSYLFALVQLIKVWKKLSCMLLLTGIFATILRQKRGKKFVRKGLCK